MPKKLLTKKDFSCGGVVWDAKHKQVLLVKVETLSGEFVWTFPKGHPEAGETDIEAALREVFEETGWECRAGKKIMDVKYFYVFEGVRYNKTVRWFAMEPVKESGTFCEDEIIACKWATLPQAKKLISYETDKKLLAAIASSYNS